MTTQDQSRTAGVVPVVGTELVNPTTESRTVFRATAASTGGAYVEVEQTYRAHSAKPPLHLHPNQDEHFTVVRGQLHAIVGELERDLYAGEVLEVPRTTPALRTDQLYFDMWSAASEVDFQPDPMRAYAVTLRYAEEFQLC